MFSRYARLARARGPVTYLLSSLADKSDMCTFRHRRSLDNIKENSRRVVGAVGAVRWHRHKMHLSRVCPNKRTQPRSVRFARLRFLSAITSSSSHNRASSARALDFESRSARQRTVAHKCIILFECVRLASTALHCTALHCIASYVVRGEL